MLTDGRGKFQCQRDYISAGREQMAERCTATCAYSLHSFASITAPAVTKAEVSGGKNMKEKFSLPSLSGSVTETFSYIDFGITKHREISDT